MNNKNYGKDFERKFKQDFLKSFKECSIDRIYDSMSGFKHISNISDFIGYVFPNIMYLECKSHRGASIPFANITQYSTLKKKVGIKGVRVGIILWLIEKKCVLYIPISTITQMVKDGKKSVGLKAIEEGYNIKILPSKERFTFLDTDYSLLANLEEGE